MIACKMSFRFLLPDQNKTKCTLKKGITLEILLLAALCLIVSVCLLQVTFVGLFIFPLTEETWLEEDVGVKRHGTKTWRIVPGEWRIEGKEISLNCARSEHILYNPDRMICPTYCVCVFFFLFCE